jgi:putative sigma-54 modulation protein
MKINVKATGIELTPAISAYVDKKVSTLEKLLDPNITGVLASVEVGRVTEHHKSGSIFRAEIHLTGGGLDLYADSQQDDLYVAIDEVKDEILHSLSQSKGKKETLARRGSRVLKDMMKGLYSGTSKGLSWGVERLKFKNLRSFKKRP